jgi:hypothetical protein
VSYKGEERTKKVSQAINQQKALRDEKCIIFSCIGTGPAAQVIISGTDGLCEGILGSIRRVQGHNF